MGDYMKYTIQPYNEGQELNYIDVVEFRTKLGARRYARKMLTLLAKALPHASISVSYKPMDTGTLYIDEDILELEECTHDFISGKCKLCGEYECR